MRSVKAEHVDTLIHGVRAFRIALNCELASQWGLMATQTVDVDRGMEIVAAYEHESGTVLTDVRQLIDQVKDGRKRGM